MISHYNMEKEFRVLKALMSTDMKSPKVFWFEPDPAVMGRPFYVMERVLGEVPVPPMKDEKQILFADEKIRRALAEDFVDILVRLHRVDWRALGLDFLGDPGPGKGSAREQVKYWEDNIRHDQLEPHPVVTQAVLWLRTTCRKRKRRASSTGITGPATTLPGTAGFRLSSTGNSCISVTRWRSWPT
jgi:aminoglycoside phosphotransferase (APT) family kinase protein